MDTNVNHETAPAEGDDNAGTAHDHILDVIRTKDEAFASRHRNESEQTYLKRVLRQLNSVDSDLWDSLPDDAKLWNNSALDAFKAGGTLPIIPGMEVTQPAKPATTTRQQVEIPDEDEPAPKRKRAARGEGKAKKEAKPPREKGVGMTFQFRRLMLQHLDMPRKELMAKGITAIPGISPQTLNVVYADTRSVVEMLKEMGHLKDSVPLPK